MPTFFCISVHFLQPFSHGRGESGEPEWPPSPLRLFQALIAGAAARWNERMRLTYAVPALEWLEKQPLPTIVATNGAASEVKCQFYVPDNTADQVVPAWSRGDVNKPVKRTEKIVRPTHLRGGEAVHYLFPLADGACPHFAVLEAAARSVTHLGWGVDMVAGNASLLTDAAQLVGERWFPANGPAENNLRVPQPGTLDDLIRKHDEFLNRLSGDGFKPVGPLRDFRVVGYRRATDPAPRKWVAFAILKSDASGNASFDTARRCRDVAAWVRNATAQVCQEWSDLARFVHGHDEQGNQSKGEHADDRFMYLPLPTINFKLSRVESTRRVLVAAPPRFADRIDWIRRRLPGQDLVDLDGEVQGLLNILPTSDWVLKQYTEASDTWSTVTPVVMPGHDDGDAAEAERLLRRALVQAGLSDELARTAELEWRAVGFRAGADLAKRYRIPESPNRWPTVHVRVRFSHKITGPLAIGAGRYRGFGLFAVDR